MYKTLGLRNAPQYARLRKRKEGSDLFFWSSSSGLEFVINLLNKDNNSFYKTANGCRGRSGWVSFSLQNYKTLKSFIKERISYRDFLSR